MTRADQIAEVTLMAVVTRADGTVEDLGVIATTEDLGVIAISDGDE